MACLNVTVDPFAVAEPSELPDWRLPLSFMKSRHVEKIETTHESDEWRMKDRVGREAPTNNVCLHFLLYPFHFPLSCVCFR